MTPYPTTESSNKQDHSQLAYTARPDLADVDERGFRNSGIMLEEADLAVIGDSHTYGNNVESGDSFPSIVAETLGWKVYNLGIGSYGIYQYKVLMDELLQFGVRDVVLALYPANDLVFHCKSLRTDFWIDYVIEHELSVPDCGGKAARERRERRKSNMRLRKRLRKSIEESAIVQVVAELLRGSRIRSLTRENSGDEYYWLDQGQFVEKVRVQAHAQGTSLEDGDVRMNFDNSLLFLREARDRLSAASVGLAVLIVPSKERVLYEWALGAGQAVDEEFENLLSGEIALTREYVSFFRLNHIPYVDATADVVEALERTITAGEVFYLAADGHPLKSGYEAYAAAAVRGIERLNGKGSQTGVPSQEAAAGAANPGR